LVYFTDLCCASTVQHILLYSIHPFVFLPYFCLSVARQSFIESAEHYQASNIVGFYVTLASCKEIYWSNLIWVTSHGDNKVMLTPPYALFEFGRFLFPIQTSAILELFVCFGRKCIGINASAILIAICILFYFTVSVKTLTGMQSTKSCLKYLINAQR